MASTLFVVVPATGAGGGLGGGAASDGAVADGDDGSTACGPACGTFCGSARESACGEALGSEPGISPLVIKPELEDPACSGRFAWSVRALRAELADLLSITDKGPPSSTHPHPVIRSATSDTATVERKRSVRLGFMSCTLSGHAWSARRDGFISHLSVVLSTYRPRSNGDFRRTGSSELFREKTHRRTLSTVARAKKRQVDRR